MLISLVFSALVLSTLLIYFTSYRYNLHPLAFVLSNIVGYIIFTVLGNLLFSFLMEDSGVVFADYGSLVGGGLSWTAAIIGVIIASRVPKEQGTEFELASKDSVRVNDNTIQTPWGFTIQGLIAVSLANSSAVIIDFIVFVIYGFIGFEITALPILIARIIYIFVCVAISFLISSYLVRRKAKLIDQSLFSGHTISGSRTESETVVKVKSRKNGWLWGIGSCALLTCIAVVGIFLFLTFYQPEEPTFPLTGSVSFPSSVKNGDDFDFIITLTNSTSEPLFIKHIVLHDFLTAPSLLVGAKVISVEPNMDSEPLGTRNDVEFSYFREIKPGETLTIIYHMRAENVGTYYENVGVYAKDHLKPDPAFIPAYQYATAKIEITP